MIKNVLKYMFSLLIICLGIVNLSFGADGYVPFGNSLNFMGNNCNFGNNLSFNCQKGGITLSNFGENNISSLFWLNDGIGFYYSPNPNNFDNIVRQGYINTGFYVCYGDTQTIIDNNWIMSCPSPSANCAYGFSPSGLMDYNSLISLLTSKVPLYAYNPDGSNGVLFSLLYDDFYFSVYSSFTNYSVCGTFKNGVVEENIGITGNSLSNFTYGNNVLYFPNSTWNGGNIIDQSTGNVVEEIVTSGDLISYFENSPLYGFDSQICYVGTNDLSSPYESGLAYYPGTGKTIFDLYERLYGTGEYTINKMGTFLNTWWINYFTFWENDNRDENGNPLYVAKFDGNNFWLDYQDLTSPFINNLAAIYFMASKITMYGQQSTIGEEIATYCYYKLGEIENVIDDSNQAYWNNAGNYEKQRQKNIGEYQDPSGDLTGGFRSKLGIYDNTGDKTDFASNFKNFYAKMSGKLDNISDFNGFGIIPDYILGFLVLIVLFRILRGKGRN